MADKQCLGDSGFSPDPDHYFSNRLGSKERSQVVSEPARLPLVTTRES